MLYSSEGKDFKMLVVNIFHNYDDALKFVNHACNFIKSSYDYIDEYTGYLSFNPLFYSKIDQLCEGIELYKSAIINECLVYS